MERVDEDRDDLRTRLHAMESKLRRMRDQRDSHSDLAKSAADSRNSVNNQGSELRESIKSRMEEQKEIRAKAKVHQARRDEVQKGIRELLSMKKNRRGEGPGKSVVIQLSETLGEIDRIENRIMTDGALSLEKENSLLKKLRALMSRRDELIPEVEEQHIISIDLGDMDESIQKLRAEADNEHKMMIEQNELADKIWEEIKPMLEERDFLRGESDRLHSIFIDERKKADDVHSNIVEMLSKVNAIRDELRSEQEQRKKAIRDHNESVRQALRGPDKDERLAETLSKKLFDGGSITFGGVVSEDKSNESQPKQVSKRAKRKLGTSRGGKK